MISRRSNLRYLLTSLMLTSTTTIVAFAPRNFGVAHRARVGPVMMASGGALNVRAVGIGSAAPSTVLTNADLESVVETSDEWISSRTGISERRVLVANDDEDSTPQRLSALSTAAASHALTMSGLSPTDIDLVICCSSTPDELFGDACTVQAALGCTNAVAFDLVAACSGFLFGTVTAGQFLSHTGGHMKNALVIGSDALSRWIDWEDRNVCILFGDGAGAMVMSKCDEADTDSFGLLGYSLHSDGSSRGDLTCGYALLAYFS